MQVASSYIRVGPASCEVKAVKVKAHELLIFGAEDTVLQDFGCCEIRRACSEFAGIILDYVAASSDANTIEIILLWLVVHDNAPVGDGMVSWYVAYLRVRHDKHGVSPFFTCFPVTLCQISKFFSKCGGPYIP
jgi:hypothetical protein